MVNLSVAWLLCAFTTVAVGAVTSCSAPAVFPGDPASITCYFSEDVRQTKKNIKVQRRNANASDFDPDSVDTIVDCYWLDADNIKCDVQSSYSLDDPVRIGRQATVRIAKASQKHVGRYMCEAVPSDPSDIEACDFQLKSEPPYLTVAEFQEKFLLLTIIAAAALVVSVTTVCVFCGIRLHRCFKKRPERRHTNSDKTNQDEHVQLARIEQAARPSNDGAAGETVTDEEQPQTANEQEGSGANEPKATPKTFWSCSVS